MSTTTTSTTTSVTLNSKTPEVPVFQNDASVNDIVAAMKIAGGCIIRNAVSQEDLDNIEKDIRPLLNKDAPWSGSFFPAQTRRAYALLGVSDIFTSKIVMHPTYQAVSAKFLTLKHWFWEGQNKQWAVSKPQLNNTVVFSIAPGATNQPLHRDDSIHQWVPKAVDVYPSNEQRDASVGFFVAAKKATKQNGATRFIPGSHLWGHETPPNEDLCQYAEMERGDAFLMLASCFHGGSANTTEDQERLIFSSFMTRGVLRQEENQYLAVSQERMKQHPVEVQKVAGYSLSEPFLGWVQSTDPRSVLDPSLSGNADMWTGAEEPDDV